MYLTEEQKTLGRRNFLKVLAGTPALLALGGAALTRGPVRGGPVKIALIGTGDMGHGLLAQYQKEFCDLKALCDINSRRRAQQVDFMVKQGWPKPNEYDDWQEMLQKEDLEAVHIATPLWTHASITMGALTNPDRFAGQVRTGEGHEVSGRRADWQRVCRKTVTIEHWNSTGTGVAVPAPAGLRLQADNTRLSLRLSQRLPANSI
jgi:hypothetical protein